MLNPKSKPSWRFFVPLLLAIFFLSLLSTRTKRAPWYEQLAWNSISPVTSILSWLNDSLGGVWQHYFFLVGVEKKNVRLQNEVAALQQKAVQYEEMTVEVKRLRNLLDLRQKEWPGTIAARVIAMDPRAEFRSLRIDKGSDDGVAADMPVIAIDGLVGKVGPVFKDEAIILLIADPASHVDVVVQRSRVRGLLVGAGLGMQSKLQSGFLMTRLEYVSRESDIQDADILVTSGLDRLFPKGILVGEVEGIKENQYGIFLKAKVIPAVDFSKLEEVLVLKRS